MPARGIGDKVTHIRGSTIWDRVNRRHIGDAIDPHWNSLNFLRLVLAATVLLSHAYTIGRFGNEGFLHGTSLGTIAVDGFFGISGYLIAGSAMRNGAGRYLWQRCLRILPGFWVAIVATAFVFGLVGWVSQHHVVSYASGPDGPWSYVWRNWLLRIVQPTIKGTAWNGSLWTLFYEALCYLALLGLALAGLLRRRLGVLLLVGGSWMCVAVITLTSWDDHFNVFQNWVWMNLLKFGVIFLVGAVIYLYRDHVPDSGWLALGCAGVFTASLWLPNAHGNPAYAFADSDLLAPLVAYPMLWLGGHLPFQPVGSRNDYSYGTYVFAYPVTVLLAVWGANRWGYLPFAALSMLATIPCAMGSWWLIERPALSLRKVKPSELTARLTGRAEAR